MSHVSQQKFIAEIRDRFPDFFKFPKLLEVGSYDVNGSIRSIIQNTSQHIGLDVAPGKGVDLVVGGQEFDGPSNHFDVVISSECFEHNPYWLETFINMIRMCKHNGIVIFTCATTGRAEHGTSRTSPTHSLTTSVGWEYYKNLTAEDFTSKIDFNLHFNEWNFRTVHWELQDLYFYGIKK